MKDLIKQYVGTGVQVPKYQLSKLSGNLLKTYFKGRIVSNRLGDYELLILNELDKVTADKYITNLRTQGIKFLTRNLDENGTYDLDILPLIFANNKFVTDLNEHSMYFMLSFSNEFEKVIDMMLTNDTIISNLDTEKLDLLLGESKYPDKIINTILNNEGFMRNADNETIGRILGISKEPEELIRRLGDRGKEYIGDMSVYGTSALLKTAIEPERVMNMFGEYWKDNYVNVLTDDDMITLLSSSVKPSAIMNILGKKGAEYINNLITDDIRELIALATNRDGVINIITSSDSVGNLSHESALLLLTNTSNKNSKAVVSRLKKAGHPFS